LFKDKGISMMAHECLAKSEGDIRKELYTNIILTGGNTLLSGFVKRFERDLITKGHKAKTIPIPSFPASRETVWMGGSILSSLGSFQQMWLSKQDVAENGVACVSKKCP